VLTQQYAPDDVVGRDYYRPVGHGAERDVAQRMPRLRRIVRGEPSGTIGAGTPATDAGERPPAVDAGDEPDWPADQNADRIAPGEEERG
jgi:putative ATPase